MTPAPAYVGKTAKTSKNAEMYRMMLHLYWLKILPLSRTSMHDDLIFGCFDSECVIQTKRRHANAGSAGMRRSKVLRGQNEMNEMSPHPGGPMVELTQHGQEKKTRMKFPFKVRVSDFHG